MVSGGGGAEVMSIIFMVDFMMSLEGGEAGNTKVGILLSWKSSLMVVLNDPGTATLCTWAYMMQYRILV